MLLLHGLGASSRYWDEVMARVEGQRMVAPDLLGFGRSPAPPDAAYDVACHLEALEPFIDDGMTVVGHSAGAILATALAAVHPDSVRHLILVSAPAYPDRSTAQHEVDRLGTLARLTAEDRLGGRLMCELMCHLRPVAIALAPIVVRDLPREVAADGARHTWASYSRTLRRVVIDHLVVEDLAAVDVPVTFIHGCDDRTASISHVRNLVSSESAAGRPVSLQVVSGDHHVPVRSPQVVAQAIAAI